MCILNVNFNVFFKLIKVHLLVSELYIYQTARCNDKNTNTVRYIEWYRPMSVPSALAQEDNPNSTRKAFN